jgi:phage head maturation protease
MPELTQQIPMLSTRAAVQPQTYNEDARTVELVWTTGAQVRRFDWMEGPYLEELSLDAKAIRMDRLNSGAPLLANHDARSLDAVIGVVEKAWIDGNQGRATVRFSDREDVAPIISDVRAGILRNISVGYQVHEYEIEKPTERGGMPTYRATDWEPMELSIVTIPADSSAQIRGSQELHSVSLTIRGNSMSEPSENQTPADEVQAPVETPVAPDANEIRAQVRTQELSRIASIRDAVRKAKLDDTFADKLIDKGISIDEARASVLDAMAAKSDASATPSQIELGKTHEEKALRGMEEALLARAGLVKHEDLAGNEFRGMRLSDFARMSLEKSGANTRGMSYDSMAQAVLRNGQTTSDFPVLLENVMHKTLLAAYQTAPDTWRQIARVGSVSDFRAWKRLRTGTLANLTAVNEAGELTNMPISDATAESVQASRFGNIISITPETIVNDDFDWIANQASALGRAAARTIEAAVYAKLIANPNMSDGNALLSSDHGNIQTSGGAISVATVDAGRVAMAQQMDNDSNDYLNIRPSILLCPISMGGTARVVAGSQYDPDSAARLLVPNKVNGLISTVIDTPRLSTGWYLLANPTDAPVIEVVFLDGNQNPRIQQEESFRTKGMSWSVELPFGVGIVDYRGIYWNDGA